jgi:hypothetical protein
LNVASNTGGSRSGTATIAGLTFTITQGAGACGALDVTSQVTVSLGGYTWLTIDQYEQNLVLRNTSGSIINPSIIPGPVYLVLLGVPTHHPLIDNDNTSLATGAPLALTTCFSTQGDYLVTVSLGDLAWGQTVSEEFLWLTGPLAGGPAGYTYKVLSGTPSQ